MTGVERKQSDLSSQLLIGSGIAGNLIGNLTNGVLSDRFGGHRVFVFALGLSAAVIGIFGAATEAKAFLRSIPLHCLRNPLVGQPWP
jgi:MFS family permease